MKKILAIILVCTFVFGLTACTGDTHISVNAENTDQLSGGKFGKSAMVEIGDGLYYDSTTRIVYWWNGVIRSNCATSPSPYYAPNGLPYRYNPETNTFEEIEDERS
jgi:hypothetical protein